MKQSTMNSTTAALIGALLFLGSVHAQQPQRRQAAPPANKAQAVDPAQAAIEKKLDAIMIPPTEYKGSSLMEAVDNLRTWSKDLDATTQDPTKKGINFMIRAPRGFQPGTVRLNLEKMTLRKALENIAEASGTRFQIDGSGITLVPKDTPDSPKPKDSSALREAARKITIPVINFEDTPLDEAVAYLNEQLKEHSEGAPAFTLSIDPEKVDPATRVKELRLKNVSADEALQYFAQATHTNLALGDKEIRVTRR